MSYTSNDSSLKHGRQGSSLRLAPADKNMLYKWSVLCLNEQFSTNASTLLHAIDWSSSVARYSRLHETLVAGERWRLHTGDSSCAWRSCVSNKLQSRLHTLSPDLVCSLYGQGTVKPSKV